jgi:diguanylate cyclase (GGDEF)-like protein
MFHNGPVWLAAVCLAAGGIVWFVLRKKRAERAGAAAEARRAQIVGQLERGEPLGPMLAMLSKSLEGSCSRLSCNITLTGPVYSPEDYSVKEKAGSVFPIVDTSGSRVGLLTVRSPTETLTSEESRAVEDIRNLAAIIAEHRSTYAELQPLDGRDRLTGLANESALAERLRTLIEGNLPENAPALFVFELRRVTQVNNRLGRDAGDIYIQQASARIAKCFRSGDLVTRIGDDDFAAVVPGLNAAAATRICQSAIDAFGTPFVIEGFPIVGDVSIGVSAFPRGGRTPDELRFSAEAALSVSRKQDATAGDAATGRGSRFTICSPEIRERAISIARAERLIRLALNHYQCDLFYQPQMTVNGALSGMKALARTREPDPALRSRDSFIVVGEQVGEQAGEQAGTEGGIGSWIIPEALRQYSEWLRKGLNPVRIAVDVSQLRLSLTEVFDQIVSYMKTFGLGPETMQIELTESAAALADKTSFDAVWQFRSAGISVSLGAFGREYSSPGALGGLPVDALRIDKSLVGRLTEPDGSTGPLSATIAAAHTLRMTVIAEDIETEEQMWSLRRLGCDVMEGDHIAVPLDGKAAGDLLAARLKNRRSGS